MSDHLTRAKEYIAKGEDFYRKAADEIISARAEDTTLGYREIAESIGRSAEWARRLVQWRTSDEDLAGPWAGDERSMRGTKNVLADPEQRRRVIASLPADARASIAADILKDPAVTDAAHDDSTFTSAVAGARSRIDAKRDQRHDERERITRGMDEDELRFDRAKQAVRDGNYGDAERLLKGLPIDDERAAWMRKQAERHRYLAAWFDAWADARPIEDADLAEWLAG